MRLPAVIFADGRQGTGEEILPRRGTGGRLPGGEEPERETFRRLRTTGRRKSPARQADACAGKYPDRRSQRQAERASGRRRQTQRNKKRNDERGIRKMGKLETTKEYREFEAKYSKEVKELLVLTSEFVGGACRMGKSLWNASAEFLACVDPETGELSEHRGNLFWLCEEPDRDNWIHNLKNLRIYRIKCRKMLPQPAPGGEPLRQAASYLLVDVIERSVQHSGLEQVLEAYKKPVLLEDACGRFQLERQFDWFSGQVDWLGESCRVALSCDEDGGETAAAALEIFRKIYAASGEWDRKFRAFAAAELTELANEWNEDEDDEDDSEENVSGEITEKAFAERIRISELSVQPDGDYTAYYDDDDLFYGHVIVIEGNVDTGMESAQIAG